MSLIALFFKGKKGLNLYRIPIAREIFLDMLEIWSFQFKVESI